MSLKVIKLATLILFLGVMVGQAQTVSPLNPAVFQSQTVAMSCTANCGTGGTWLCSGCSGSINSSTGVYTAPSTVTAKQSMGGYQLLPNNHILNTRIDSLPVNPNSATWLAGDGSGASLNFFPSFPINYTNNSTPTASLIFAYTPGNNGAFQMPAFPNARIENGYLSALAADQQDHHMIRINTQSGQVQEQYQYYKVGANGDYPLANSQSGVKYNPTDYAMPGGTDAAGLQLSPLTLRVQEVEQACANGTSINHAMRVTLQSGYLANSFVWPALGYASTGGTIPYGARFRLKSSYSISGFSACAQIILTALKDYGFIMADGGSGWTITTEYDAWSPNLMAVFTEIQNAAIGNANWEAVDESSLEISASSGEANTNRETICYKASSGTACTDVVLEGVAVNLAQNILYIMAGTPSQQLTAFVHDSGSNTVTWSMNPSVGTLTSGGLYTAPSSISSPTSTTITATSTVNSSAAASMTLWVFPASGFRGLAGTDTSYTDSNGNVWTAGIGYGTSTTPQVFGCCNNDYPFPRTTDYQLFWNNLASSLNAGDISTNFLVPAGQYKITYNLDAKNPVGQEGFTFISQGNVLASDVDPTAAAGGQHLPYTYTTTQTVGSNNQLSFYIWAAGGNPIDSGDISSLSIVGDSSSGLTPPTNLTATVQ